MDTGFKHSPSLDGKKILNHASASGVWQASFLGHSSFLRLESPSSYHSTSAFWNMTGTNYYAGRGFAQRIAPQHWLLLRDLLRLKQKGKCNFEKETRGIAAAREITGFKNPPCWIERNFSTFRACLHWFHWFHCTWVLKMARPFLHLKSWIFEVLLENVAFWQKEHGQTNMSMDQCVLNLNTFGSIHDPSWNIAAGGVECIMYFSTFSSLPVITILVLTGGL